MKNSTNHSHYYPSNLPESIRNMTRYFGPVFEGQGCSKRSGSDAYGLYITKIVSPKFIGLVQAHTVLHHNNWTGGEVDCSMPADKNPTLWLKQYGKCWYQADVSGHRIPGAKYPISFNGAYAYRDPSL